MRGSVAIARRMIDWALHSEGSTRSSALIRIGLAVLIWTRWARELALFHRLPPAEVALAANFFPATALMFAGLFSRVATAWTAVTLLVMYYYFGFHLGVEPWTHHHTYLLAFATFLSALTPNGRSYSVDRWLALRRWTSGGESPPPERGNLWGLRLMALQVSLIYVWTAFDKSNPAFLGGDRLEAILMWYFVGSNYPQWAGFHFLMVVVSWVTVLLEYTLGIGLLFASARRWLIPLGMVFHSAIFLLLPVLTFSATMWLLYLAILDPDSVHRVLERLQGRGEAL